MHELVYTCPNCGVETRELARDVGVPEHHVGGTFERTCHETEHEYRDEAGCGERVAMRFEGIVPTGAGGKVSAEEAFCPLCLGSCRYEGADRDRSSQDIALPEREAYDGLTLWSALEAADF